jgi:hypothetical protein
MNSGAFCRLAADLLERGVLEWERKGRTSLDAGLMVAAVFQDGHGPRES